MPHVQPEPLRTDLRGRVDRIRLPESCGLVALYEAVVNAIQSTEELTDSREARITVRILRELPQQPEGGKTYPVRGFEVEDDGVGFTDENYGSFMTSDSRRKQTIGGKGVGRLVWLKVFSSIEVESSFRDGVGSQAFRRFAFSVDGILPLPEGNVTPDGTRVRLQHPSSTYSESLQGSTRTIAIQILEHCLVYFVDDQRVPKVTVTDGIEEPVVLSDLLAHVLERRRNVTTFRVGSQQFRLVSMLMKAKRNAVHRISLCANKRLVRSIRLTTYVPELTEAIELPSGETVVYHGYLVGELLDARVYPDRDDFWFGQTFAAEESGANDIEVITFESIAEGAAIESRKFLEPFLAPMRQAKERQVSDYVEQEAPQFRYLLENHREEVLTIRSTATKQGIHQHLSVIEFRHDQATSTKLGEALAALDGDRSPEDHVLELDAVLTELSDSARSKLARYVLYRRTIIGILEKCSRVVPGSTHTKLESAVHQVVFPMRKTSSQVPFLQNNLWLVDERLSFHQFLASDRRLDELGEVIEIESEDRPDLAIFHRAMAFAEPDRAFQSIILVDFKRPSREGYKEADPGKDPIVQLTGYVQKLRSGKVRTKDGSHLRVKENIPFYAYLIADVPPALENILVTRGFTPTPDGEGHYWYNQILRVYFEVITYRKLIRDAQQRNHAFVHMLGLPISET